MNDKLIRQLELYIDKGGTLQNLKSILSISGDDDEFCKELMKKNSNSTKCTVCGNIIEEENLKVCNNCADEYKF